MLIENTSIPLPSTVFSNKTICTGFIEVRVGSYQSSVKVRLVTCFPHTSLVHWYIKGIPFCSPDLFNISTSFFCPPWIMASSTWGHLQPRGSLASNTSSTTSEASITWQGRNYQRRIPCSGNTLRMSVRASSTSQEGELRVGSYIFTLA